MTRHSLLLTGLTTMALGAGLTTAQTPAGSLKPKHQKPTATASNQAPVCSAGPIQIIECNGPLTAFQMDATGSYDPEGSPLTYAWSTTCPNAHFDDPTSATPVLFLDMTGQCLQECGSSKLFLTVSDGQKQSTCSTAVQAQDTLAPVIVTAEANPLMLWTTGYPTQTDPLVMGGVTAVDLCDANPVLTYSDVVVPGTPPSSIELVITRTWEAIDACGNVATPAIQTITIVGPKYFGSPVLDIVPGVCPNTISSAELVSGVVHAVILGDSVVAGNHVDPATLTLARANGQGGTVTPLAVAVGDFGSPAQSPSNCHGTTTDGFLDLALAIDSIALVQNLGLTGTSNGTFVEVRLTGSTFGGIPFKSVDSLLMQIQ